MRTLSDQILAADMTGYHDGYAGRPALHANNPIYWRAWLDGLRHRYEQACEPPSLEDTWDYEEGFDFFPYVNWID